MPNSLQSLSSAGKLCSLCIAGSLAITSQFAFAATLEEVIVTAQKREQSLSDVPIAIRAFSGNFVFENNIFELSEITERVPNVQHSESPFQPIVAVRGLGASGGNRGFESQVVLFSDGIYGGRPTQFVAPMFDVERVEVVKGPQTVLFGKNATGGVISVVSARPGDEFEGYVSGGYEAEYDGYLVEGVMSGPLSDELGARVAVRYKEDGGYLKNTRFNRDEPFTDNLALRGVMTWEPNDAMNVVAKLEYTEMDGGGRTGQLVCGVEGTDYVDTGPLGLGGAECILDNRRSTGAQSGPLALNADFPQVKSLDTMNAALNIDWDVGDHVLTLVGGYSRFDNSEQSYDSPDRSSIGFIDSSLDGGKFEQYSVEARIASPTEGQLEYILGAFYLESDEQMSQDLGLVAPPRPPVLPRGGVMRKIFDIDQEVQTWSLFGSVTVNMAERLSATAQLRYSEEDKDYSTHIYQLVSPIGLDPSLRAVFMNVYSPRDMLPPPTEFDLGRSEEDVDYAFNLQWDMTDNIMAYLSYSKGSKAGGYSFFPITLDFRQLPADEIQYEDEEGHSVEGGIKATLLDNRAQFNLSVFRTEYDDMQQITFDPNIGGFAIANADVISVGAELDGQFVISEQIRVGGSLGYLDAEFDNFMGADCAAPPHTGNCIPGVGQTLDGDPLPFAPDWTAHLFADFSMPIGSDYRLKLHVDGNFTDDILFQVDQDPLDTQDSYWIWNGRLALQPVSERWELSLQAKNLGDEDRIVTYSADASLPLPPPVAQRTGAHGYSLRPGRQLYLQARLNF